MRDYQLKVNKSGLPDSITTTRFGAGEFNSIATELENAVSTSGQVLGPADGIGEITDQLPKAMSIYGAGGAGFYLDTGAVNAYVLTIISPKVSPPAYFDGFLVLFEPGTINSGPSTVNVASLGVKNITKPGGAALTGGELTGVCKIRYKSSGDRFEVVRDAFHTLPGAFVNIVDFGAISGGSSVVNGAALTLALATGKSVLIPDGAFRFSGQVNISTSETTQRKLFGLGPSRSCLLFEGTSGLKAQGLGTKFQDFSIVNRSAYTVPPDTFAQVDTSAPVKANITGGLIGIESDGDNIMVENVLITGFDRGYKNTSGYYHELKNVRSQQNLIGMENNSNFGHSYGCKYNANFDRNINILGGGHQFHDCACETCTDYSVNNVNYPDGGIYVATGCQAVFSGGWHEDINCYVEDSARFELDKPENVWNILTKSPIRIRETNKGISSVNLVAPPYSSKWTIGAGVTLDTSDTNLSGGKRYTIATINGGAGVSKQIFSRQNTRVRGMLVSNVSNRDFQIYMGCWIQLKTSNFDPNNLFLITQFEDSLGNFFNQETPARTQIDLNPASVDVWHYIGSLVPAQYTVATGNPLASVRLRLSLGDDAVDYSASPRVCWFAESEIRFFNTNSGHEITHNRTPRESFSYRNNASQVDIATGAATDLIFDTVVWNNSATFSSNTFTAKRTGEYLFSFLLRLAQIDTAATLIEIELVTSNRTYNYPLHPGAFAADPNYFPLSGSIIADMDQGDTAKLRITITGGAAQTDLLANSYFQGTFLPFDL